MLLDEGLDLSAPIHVLVSPQAARAPRGMQRLHYADHIPGRSVMNIGGDVDVVCPELCFVHMASTLPLVELIRLGYELCGRYASFDEMRYDCEPVTTPARLQAYLSRAAGIKGVKRARRALQYVLANSASPMETALAMLLTLPYSLGGYSLPAPLLNERVEADGRSDNLLHQEFYVCDLLWKEAGVGIEYDSTAFHSSAQRMAHDAQRRGDLAVLGVHVETVTADQVFNWAQTDKLAGRMAKLLGQRIRPTQAGFLEKQAQLRDALLPQREREAETSVPVSDLLREGAEHRGTRRP